MPDRTVKRGEGSLVIDLQGPFIVEAEQYETFATVQLWPDVSIFITSEQQADEIIAALMKAKTLLPKEAEPDA